MALENWQLNSTAPELADTLHKGLQNVMDPELGMSIIQLGLVTCRSKTEEVLGIPTSIEMGREFWDRSFMEDDPVDWGLY